MNRLTKEQLSRKAELVDSLNEVKGEIEEKINAFNEKMAEAWGEVEAVIGIYNERVAEANEFLTDCQNAAQEFYDEKSEKWQEGDKGQAYQDWMNNFDNTLEEIDLDQPDQLEIPDPSPGVEDLESLADSPEG